jgi:hypothetical protein
MEPREGYQSAAPHGPEIYARWQCEECGSIRGGFISPYDFKPRRCFGIPKNNRTDGGRICGGRMVEIHRDREAA